MTKKYIARAKVERRQHREEWDAVDTTLFSTDVYSFPPMDDAQQIYYEDRRIMDERRSKTASSNF